MDQLPADNHNKTIRIGCASGFWGDTNTAAAQLVRQGNIDYLIFDYLAEITMSVMAGQKMKNPEAGYATDFVSEALEPVLPEIKRQGIKVLSNAGGINPLACREALLAAAERKDINLQIAVVLGDDLLPRLAEYAGRGITESDTGAALPSFCLSMNAYLGVPGLVAALQAGADIVITGRVVDSALALAPMIYEFGWPLDDFDKLAQGSLAGHIIECGAQCTGGNFTDWRLVQGFDNMGFPVVEVAADASFMVTKPENTGGLVSEATVAEQMVYEIGNPQAYFLPDVICDFTQVKLQQTGSDQVTVSGARGLPPTKNYKVCATYPDGYRCTATFLLAGLDAKEKAQTVTEAILAKTNRLFASHGWPAYSATNVELLGTEATYGAQGKTANCREIVVKIACAHPSKKALTLFSREIAQAATGMTPGITGLIGGRPRVSPVIRLFSCLVAKADIDLTVNIRSTGKTGTQIRIDLPALAEFQADMIVAQQVKDEATTTTDLSVPLVKLAWARSGDKGNHANIGVIARSPEYLPYIRKALSAAMVKQYLAHVLDPEDGEVSRWELPGINGLNFLLRNALGGGGIASLRIDPQGKAFAQQLLEYPVPVPNHIAASISPTLTR